MPQVMAESQLASAARHRARHQWRGVEIPLEVRRETHPPRDHPGSGRGVHPAPPATSKAHHHSPGLNCSLLSQHSAVGRALSHRVEGPAHPGVTPAHPGLTLAHPGVTPAHIKGQVHVKGSAHLGATLPVHLGGILAHYTRKPAHLGVTPPNTKYQDKTLSQKHLLDYRSSLGCTMHC